MLKSSTLLLLFQSYLPEKLKKEMSFLPFEPSLSLWFGNQIILWNFVLSIVNQTSNIWQRLFKTLSTSRNNSDSIRTQNHLVPVWLNDCVFVYELSDCGFESRCCHLNFRYCAFFKQGVPWDSRHYRGYFHSETRTWHDNNIKSTLGSQKWFLIQKISQSWLAVKNVSFKVVNLDTLSKYRRVKFFW